MIKRFVFLLLVACLVAFPAAVHADVLVEPSNDFYSRHRDECTYLNRSFYANGEAGFVSIKKEPGSNNEVVAIQNGEELFIMFTYDRNGEMWGVAEIYTPDKPYNEWPTGWVPMNQLLLKYDYISFEEDHRSEFYPYTGGYEALFEAKDVIFWTWPGSGVQAWVLESDWRDPEADANFLQAEHAYKDSEGREWGFFPYVYANKNSWVCMSDPASSAIPAFNPPPQPELWQPKTPIPQRGISTPLLIIILVAALVVGTAVLIRVFWKPKKGDA